jgi:DNA primase
MSQIDEIKARLDIVEFIGAYVPLKKTGRNYKALCPFHSEKTPSFVVFPDSQNWRCFGCGEGGDIFSFAMRQEGWDFPEALRALAERAGVELAPPSPQRAEEQERHEFLLGLLAETARFYQAHLLESPDARHARDYVERRGLASETLDRFQVGYAPHSWDATMHHLLGLGYRTEDLIDGGLLVEKEGGGVYDRFRNRLVIPIRDAQGRIVGFGARALAEGDNPKYLNSPQSVLFDKSRTLYGLDMARRTIRESEAAVIVEGYMDVMQAHQAGFADVVAQMGTALTEPQLRLLSRYASRLVLALDPDAAGQMATERGREVIEQVSRAAAEQAVDDGVWGFDTAQRDYRATLTTEFDPRGMVRYESRLGFDIRVLTLPPGSDPDDVIRADPAHWAELVAGALPIVEYVIQTRVAGQNLDDPKVKSTIAAQLTPLIDDVVNPVERSHYRQRLARLLKVSEQALFQEKAAGERGRARPRPAPKPEQAASGAPPEGAFGGLSNAAAAHPREAFCLAALIHYPRLIYQVNRVLFDYLDVENLLRYLPGGRAVERWPAFDGLAPQVTPADFSQPDYRALFEAWMGALDQDERPPLDYFRASLDPFLRSYAERWLAQPLDALHCTITPPRRMELPEERLGEEAIRGLLTLRAKRLEERIREHVYLMEDMENGGDTSTAMAFGEEALIVLTAQRRIGQAIQEHTLSGRRTRSGVPALHNERSAADQNR